MKTPLDDPAAWFAKADGDYRMGKLALEQEPGLAEFVCCHAHQCAEKYLTGFLVAHSVNLWFFHDLDYLIGFCEELDGGFGALHEPAAALQAYASQSCYPSEEEAEVTPEEAQTALANAGVIREHVLRRLRA